MDEDRTTAQEVMENTSGRNAFCGVPSCSVPIIARTSTPNQIVRPTCLSTNSEIQIGQWEQLFDGGKRRPRGPFAERPSKALQPACCLFVKAGGMWEQAERGERFTNKAS